MRSAGKKAAAVAAAAVAAAVPIRHPRTRALSTKSVIHTRTHLHTLIRGETRHTNETRSNSWSRSFIPFGSDARTRTRVARALCIISILCVCVCLCVCGVNQSNIKLYIGCDAQHMLCSGPKRTTYACIMFCGAQKKLPRTINACVRWRQLRDNVGGPDRGTHTHGSVAHPVLIGVLHGFHELPRRSSKLPANDYLVFYVIIGKLNKIMIFSSIIITYCYF